MARGAPLARAICDEAAGELPRAVRLLAPFFRDRPVAVAAIGSIASSPYVQAALGRSLADPPGRLRVARQASVHAHIHAADGLPSCRA